MAKQTENEIKKDTIAEANPEAIIYDDLDDAIVGICRICGSPDVVLYDYDKCIEVFVKQGMTDEEAVEWMEFNVVGGYLGSSTPAFAVMFQKEEE